MEMDRKGGLPRSQNPVIPNSTAASEIDTANDLAGATMASALSAIFDDKLEPTTFTTTTFEALNVGEFKIGPDLTMNVVRVEDPLTVAA